MGSQCSVELVRPLTRDCGPGDLACDGEDCACNPLRGRSSPSQERVFPSHGSHPLMHQDPSTSSTPRTPRGPAPPWAVSSLVPPVDRTATGATPPRSPTPPRLTPPGLPEEELRGAGANVVSLSAALDSRFMQELFGAARCGDAATLSTLIQKMHNQALNLICKAHEQTGSRRQQDGALAMAEHADQAAELVAAYLSKARAAAAMSTERPPQESLLGASALRGQATAVQLLLSARADPHTCDDSGCTALHRAAESGSLLTVLFVLDRLQAHQRSITLAELTNVDGETPEMFAALASATEVCHAFEIFGNMQNDAELRQLGSSFSPPETHRGSVGTGDVLTFMDFTSATTSAPGLAATALLRRCTMGCSLMRSPTQRIPEDDSVLQQLVQQVCDGIAAAEELLLASSWNSLDPGLDPALRGFATTAELRSSWQHLRAETVRSALGDGAAAVGAEEFWQTHLTAEMMCSTLQGALGDTFQLLLTMLWLYTREAWFRHALDALAASLHAASLQQSNTATPAPTPPAPSGTPASLPAPAALPSQLKPVAPLVEALAPSMQMVQSALTWFEEAGIKHSAVTYRPLSLAMLGLQRLVDKYVALRRPGDGEKAEDKAAPSERNRRRLLDPPKGAEALGSGTWLVLGAGTFFSSMSSRSEAIKRLLRTRCNTLLVIRPDDICPCYPKHMSLRGSSVDDTIFPFQTLFRVARITRSVSSDLDPSNEASACSGARTSRSNSSRWPVMIIEAFATCRHLDALELLEERGSLGPGELQASVASWLDDAPPELEQERLLPAGELLARHHQGSAEHLQQAAQLLARGSAFAESVGDAAAAARGLLGKARCVPEADHGADGKRAVNLLAAKFGLDHPETMAARSSWRELGVSV